MRQTPTATCLLEFPPDENANHASDYLATRRSIPAFQMAEPGPARAEVEEMLTLASRVPTMASWPPGASSSIAARAGADQRRIGRDRHGRQADPFDEMLKVKKRG